MNNTGSTTPYETPTNSYENENETNGNLTSNSAPVVTNTQPPLIEEDEVSTMTTTPRTANKTTQGTTPVISGGRLYQRLSKKNYNKRKSTRKAKKSYRRKN
jgi:hypothetical protein